MADAARDIPRMSATEYLQMEKQATSRHEFVNGVVYAMAGGSREHNMIVGDVFAALLSRVEPPCTAFTSDTKVKVRAVSDECFYYPDATMTCSELDNDRCGITQLSLMVEVLSRSTEDADRGYKFDHYRLLPSLQEYVLVHQERARAEITRRRADWQNEGCEPEESILLDSIGATVPIAQFYRRMKF